MRAREQERNSFDEYSRRCDEATPELEPVREYFDKVFSLAVSSLEYREKYGLTQRQLAHQAGVRRSDIRRIESGNATLKEVEEFSVFLQD